MRFGQIAENITRYTVVAMRTCASKAEINSALPLLWMCVPFVSFLSFFSANKVPPLKMSGKNLEIPIIFLSFSQWSISRSRYLFVQVVCFAYFYPKKITWKICVFVSINWRLFICLKQAAKIETNENERISIAHAKCHVACIYITVNEFIFREYPQWHSI